MSNTIIHIDGVQGSGKTYICQQLKNAECYDTDDIMYDAFNYIDENNLPKNDTTLHKVEKQFVQNIIEKSKLNIIVFVGMTVKITNPNHKFFIKINKTDQGNVYKRLLSRELDKIYNNYHKLKKVINDTTNANHINGKIDEIAKLGVHFPVSFEEFIQDYKKRIQDAIKEKYVPKTQLNIIKFINNLI
tara:strand:- start:76 stop:639 length:564 start_codon:yes stop_codon:yes gene_type:complete